MSDKESPADAPPGPRPLDGVAAAPEIDRRMMESLVCPITHGALTLDAARRELVSAHAGLAFPVRDGIPIMLESEARRLED